MSSYAPYIYSPEKSIEVLEKTENFFSKNPSLKTKIEELGWVYESIGKTIPQTTENFWSGHFFPFMESWDELQISFNLAMFGLYKQAFMSLRSGLELGLLPVYYNINDDGHKTVQAWLKSKDIWEANTPRTDTIWKILNLNSNIKSFNNQFNLRGRFNKLSFLHNYIHTKGYKFSNKFGRHKSNFQTFEEKIFIKWLEAYEEILVIITTLHLLKYPIGIIEFEWGTKCGIDNPFPVLEIFEIKKIINFLPKNYINAIKEIANDDQLTQDFYKQIQELPDMTERDVEEQIVRLDKMWIESHPEGFIGWEKQEKKIIKLFKKEKDRKKALGRIKELKKWAAENNMMKSRQERLKILTKNT